MRGGGGGVEWRIRGIKTGWNVFYNADVFWGWFFFTFSIAFRFYTNVLFVFMFFSTVQSTLFFSSFGNHCPFVLWCLVS